jgi:plastocyanin
MSLLHTRAAGATFAGLVAAGLAMAACGGGASGTNYRPKAAPSTTMMAMGADTTEPPTGPPVATDAVNIEGFAFKPAVITIKQGATVTWTNKDDEAHTVFFSFDSTRSPLLVNSANTYTKTFTTAGTFVYHCTIHPFMTGTVTVTA